MLTDYREQFSTIEQYRRFLSDQRFILPDNPRITTIHAIIIPIISVFTDIPAHKPLGRQHTDPIPDTRKLGNPPINTTRRVEHIQIHRNQPVFITRTLIIIHILNSKIHDKPFSDSKLITPLFQLKFNTLFQHNKIIQHIIILSSQHITTFTTNIRIFQMKIKLLKLAFQFQKLGKQPFKRIIRHTIASFPWPIRESNPARTLYKSVALTTELIGQNMVPHHRPTTRRGTTTPHYITITTCSKLDIIRVMSHTEIITVITTIKPPMIITMPTTPHTLAQRSTNKITKITLSTHKSNILTLSIKPLLIYLESTSNRLRINLRV